MSDEIVYQADDDAPWDSDQWHQNFTMRKKYYYKNGCVNNPKYVKAQKLTATIHPYCFEKLMKAYDETQKNYKKKLALSKFVTALLMSALK